MKTKDIVLNYEELPWHPADTTQNPQDLLATIFNGQAELMDRYHSIEANNGCVVTNHELRGELDNRRVQMRLKDLSQRTIEELMEATNELKNRPWKNTTVVTDREAFYEEVVDALHFFVEFCITAGLSADDVFNLYFKKHAVNQFRQDSNY